jgi:hypothetical protein
VATRDPPVAPGSPPGRWRARESDVTLSVFLFLLLTTTVMGWPLRDAGAGGILVALKLLTAAAGVVAIASQRAPAVAAGIAALAVAFGQLAGDERSLGLLAARLVMFGVMGAALLGRVFQPGRITVHRLLGAVSLYVLLAVVFGTAYQLVLVLRPDAFRAASGPAALDEVMWLSFVTLTTTGYGDVLPASSLARALAALEALAGVLFPAILISRLVSLVQGPASSGRAPGGGSDDR